MYQLLQEGDYPEAIQLMTKHGQSMVHFKELYCVKELNAKLQVIDSNLNALTDENRSNILSLKRKLMTL